VSDVRQRQHAEQLCAAAIRALTGEADLHFRGGRLHRGRQPVPHLPPSIATRGTADAMALRLLRSDPAVHRQWRPESELARLVFEMLEQFRVEALVPDTLPGVARNLRRRHEQWLLALRREGLTETDHGLLLYTLAEVCRSRITNQPVVEETEALIEASRAALAPGLGAHLAGLYRYRADQHTFAQHARSLADAFAAMTGSSDEDTENDDVTTSTSELALLLDFADDSVDGGTTMAANSGAVSAVSETGYRVFTTAYDRELRAGGLVRPDLLREYREQLDRRIARTGVNVARLARDLTALLAAPARDGWDSAREEGYVDGRALARLVSSPTERRIFREERFEPAADALVTFLIDCSGSMKQHREPIAAITDAFARALELAGATCEILGFTTGAWNGGRVRQDWLHAGQPAHPGRLTELSHLVFKDADTPWRLARRDIAALLKSDLFREGVDGEAVAWAAARAQSRDERRRLLVVVSDGSPMDRATALANGDTYLDSHLQDVVAGLERTAATTIFGVGIGLDLSTYYRHCRGIDTSEGAGYRVFREILDLIATPGH
jgi:cobaltochelatase CobT